MNNIFLIGYRGTGKSTVARILAQRLGWEAVDTDELLEKRQGRSIASIFAEEGETGFREKEEALLGEVCFGRCQVVATGGGVILRPENRRQLRSAGFVVWLTADAQTIQERLDCDPSTSERRPRLTVGGLAEIEELLVVRESLYRSTANLIVATAGRTPEDVAGQILAEME